MSKSTGMWEEKKLGKRRNYGPFGTPHSWLIVSASVNFKGGVGKGETILIQWGEGYELKMVVEELQSIWSNLTNKIKEGWST